MNKEARRIKASSKHEQSLLWSELEKNKSKTGKRKSPWRALSATQDSTWITKST